MKRNARNKNKASWLFRFIISLGWLYRSDVSFSVMAANIHINTFYDSDLNSAQRKCTISNLSTFLLHNLVSILGACSVPHRLRSGSLTNPFGSLNIHLGPSPIFFPSRTPRFCHSMVRSGCFEKNLAVLPHHLGLFEKCLGCFEMWE